MNSFDRKYILKWALVVGFILGGIPFFPLSLNSPNPLLIPIGPSIMALFTYLMVAYMLKNVDSNFTFWKRSLIGSLTIFSFIAIAVSLTGIIIGKEWWAWSFVIFIWGEIIAFPIGIIFGNIYGNYLNSIISNKRELKHDNKFYTLSVLLTLLIFIVVPFILWSYSR